MAIYELRTYSLYVGKMGEATKLYQELGFPALEKGGHDAKLVGYFQADTGMINQSCICGSSTTTPIAESTGQGSTPTRTLWRASRPSSGRSSCRRRSSC